MTWNKNLTRQTLYSVAVFLFILILAPMLFRSFAWAEPAVGPLAISDIKSELLGNGTIVISWKTNKPADGTVIYSDDLSFGQSKKISTLFLDRAIILDSTKPDTLYHFRVISRTPTGEEARSAHLMIQSHRPVDIAVTSIAIDPSLTLYPGQPPLLDGGLFRATIKNNGDVDLNDDFFVSVLITDDESTATDDEIFKPYSCFVEKKIEGGLKAQAEKNIELDTNDLASCDSLRAANYILTVSADYDNRIDEAVRDNNSMDVSLPTAAAAETPSFDDFDTTDISATSSNVTVALTNGSSEKKVVIEYSPDYYYSDEATQGMYLYQQDTVYDQGIYTTSLKGLEEETLYHIRVRLLNTNVVSTDETFMTKKNPQADVDRLIGLKRIDPTCRIIDQQPLGTSFWQDLGLDMPSRQPILRYRIQWNNGGWSPWYIPGLGDEDWKVNTKGEDRRVWSYFQDHVFQYETCGTDPLPAAAVNPVTTKDKYGVTIDRAQEAKSPILNNKIVSFSSALKYFKRAVTGDNWQILQDAYVYGGYSLAEITDSIIRGPGLVHPTIPAKLWRTQNQVQVSSQKIN